MSNAKYDWAKNLPWMIDLWKTGMSIPKIHQIIQNEVTGFTPKLSIVYKKFRDAGFPTEQGERNKLLSQLNIAKWPDDNPLTNGPTNRRLLPANSPSSTSECHDQFDSRIQGLGLQSQPHHQITADGFSGNWTARLCQRTVDDERAAEQLSGDNRGLEIHQGIRFPAGEVLDDVGWSDFRASPQFPSQNHAGQLWESQGIEPYGHHDVEHPSRFFNTASMPYDEIPEPIDHPQHITSPCSKPLDEGLTLNYTDFLTSSATDPFNTSSISPANSSTLYEVSTRRSSSLPRSASSNVGSRSLPRAKTRSKFNRSCTPENRNSMTTDDSGYSSRPSSPLTALVEDERFHPQSLREFKSLYRAPCHCLHEPQTFIKFCMPQSQERFKDVPKCEHCLYSGIHNLSWSAKNLKFEVFLAELKLQGCRGLEAIYDVKALDAVGNSALHYAAAGGATSDHFHALIRAGVNPYQMNTGGQLFLHCLKPDIKAEGSDSFDIDLVDLFIADLINLLNAFQPTGAFMWRDNEGMTPLDAIAMQINDTEIKEDTYRRVKAAGYRLEISTQFQDTRQEPSHPGRQVSGTERGVSPSKLRMEIPIERDFGFHHEKQNKAWEIVGRAYTEPSYVDPETGDNVLHALSRLRPQKGTLLPMIHDFVSKDVDLNLRNNRQDCPLAAFVQERPFLGLESDETGATMSKYLDALLWKDVRRRKPNKINVNLRNREGATALYYAAVRGRPDSVRSLIEAGANVNARLDVNGNNTSIFKATFKAKARAVVAQDIIKIDKFDNVISYLEHENAVLEPSIFEERQICDNSVMLMPLND